MMNYRDFIDEMVALAGRCVSADRIRAHGHPVRTNESSLPLDGAEAVLKTAFLILTPPQREAIARLLVAEREGAVHDVLAYLEWATVTERLNIEAAGESFAGKPDETMHHDYVARLQGYEWQN